MNFFATFFNYMKQFVANGSKRLWMFRISKSNNTYLDGIRQLSQRHLVHFGILA